MFLHIYPIFETKYSTVWTSRETGGASTATEIQTTFPQAKRVCDTTYATYAT